MEEDIYISEELRGKVYKRGTGLLRIPLILCYQRYIYILQCIHLFINARNCVSPDKEYEGVIFKNVNGYYCTQFHSTIVGLHALHWVVVHGRHPEEGTQICHLCSNRECFLHTVEASISVNMSMKACKYRVFLPTYNTFLHCKHEESHGFRCFPPVADNHVILDGQLFNGREEAHLFLDRQRLIQLVTERYGLDMEVARFPQERIGYIYCFICFQSFSYWNNYACHYGGHAQLNKQDYRDPSSAQWTAQLGMFLENPSLETLQEYKSDYEERRRLERNERERKRPKISRAGRYVPKENVRVVTRDWEKMEYNVYYKNIQ